MRHRYFGKKLSRTKNERRRLLQGLVRDLVTHGAMRTTLAKAKAVQPLVERLVTKAKDGSRANLTVVGSVLSDKVTEKKLLEDAKTRFRTRTSGFTRIVKLGQRRGDSAQAAILSFVDTAAVAETIGPVGKEKLQKTDKSAKSKPEKKEKIVKAKKTTKTKKS